MLIETDGRHQGRRGFWYSPGDWLITFEPEAIREHYEEPGKELDDFPDDEALGEAAAEVIWEESTWDLIDEIMGSILTRARQIRAERSSV